jgi:hypothetical protein
MAGGLARFTMHLGCTPLSRLELVLTASASYPYLRANFRTPFHKRPRTDKPRSNELQPDDEVPIPVATAGLLPLVP